MSAAEGFPCPCGSSFEHVVDTRHTKAGIRRRRVCQHCNARITTYERADPSSISVRAHDDLVGDLEAVLDRKLS